MEYEPNAKIIPTVLAKARVVQPEDSSKPSNEKSNFEDAAV